MKTQKIKIIVLLFTVLVLASGCKNSGEDKLLKAIPDTEAAENQERAIITDNITDPAKLQHLWEEYLYDAIFTVSNTMEFDSPEKIDPAEVARFCCYRYLSERGIEGLSVDEGDRSLRIVPLADVLQYSKRYFNISSFDLSKISQDDYNFRENVFTFHLEYPRNYPSYNNNPRGFFLDKAMENSDGSITAVLKEYDGTLTKRIEQIRTLTLNKRKDGSMYFVRGRREYVNNNLVNITGDYKNFDKIEGFQGNMYEISMIGETEGKLVLAHTPYDKESTASIMLVNTDTLSVDKKLDLGENIEYTDIRQSGERFIICLYNKIMVVSKKLEKLESIPVPKAIAGKINRIPQYDPSGLSDVFFGGYDISSDLTKIVYTDEIGLKLYNIKENKEILLSKAIKAPEDMQIKYCNHGKPRFVAENKKILTEISGYESILNYNLYDLENETSKTIEIGREGSSGAVRYDTGLLAVNMPKYNEAAKINENSTLYLDFKTGDVTEVKLQDPGDTGYIIPEYYSFVGQNYGAFITDKHDDSDYANNTYYINRLNLETREIEPKIISVKAAEIHILGVLEDGRVVFWYNLNPSENAVCITK